MNTPTADAWRKQLVTLLDGLVPLHMLTLSRKGISQARIDAALETISSSGDAFEPGGVRSKDARGSLLGALAEAIAMIALTNPDGVDLFGSHWCCDHNHPVEETPDA